MEEIIKLSARYGLVHQLRHIDGKLYQLEFDKKSTGTYRLIGKEGEQQIGYSVHAIDPEGGPFISIGSKINGFTVKSITATGVIEFE